MSDDILSGGRIDESTDGPNPPSVDDRSRNILQEQKSQQDQDTIGGTQFPPRVEPLPPIPVAPEVAPPLPTVPSFGFYSGSPLEEVREITRQAIADAFKNVTINGQSPSMEGSTISFNVPPPQPSASEAFLFQNGNANPVVPTTLLAPSPQQQPREDAQTVVVPPPSRPREEPESIGEQRERENNEREARDREIRISLGLDAVSPMDRPSETVTTRGPSISEQNDDRAADRARRDENVRESVGLEGESPMDEKSNQARAYEEAESRREERRENNPNFDRESDIRQEGETMSEYKERQEKLEQKKTEDADAIEGEAGITRESSGPIAVSLKRADGNGKVFAFFRSDNSVEGEPTLPKNEYYVGGGSGGDSCVGLALYTKDNGVWVGAGTVGGELPSDFDPDEGKNIANGGSGDVWAEVNISGSTGDIVSVSVDGGSSTPSNSSTSFYCTLGYYFYDEDAPQITNYGCGSVTAAVCRNWFATSSPFYQVTFFR